MSYSDDGISFFETFQRSPLYQEESFSEHQLDLLSTDVRTIFGKESYDNIQNPNELINGCSTISENEETPDCLLKAHSHSKYARDNLLRKIKVCYHTFIVIFLNDCITKEGIKGMLIKKIHGKQNQNVTLLFNKQLFDQTIQEFLSDSSNISSKYTKNGNPQNKVIKTLMSKSSALNSLFSMSYEEFYIKLFINADKECLDEKFHSILEKAPNLNNLNFDDVKYDVTVKEMARFKFIKHFYETKVRSKKQSKNAKKEMSNVTPQ